jgi:hypothetical protein
VGVVVSAVRRTASRRQARVDSKGLRSHCYFCEAVWGACSCKFPSGEDAGEDTPGFDFGDLFVTDPGISVCGRFYVDPTVYYGRQYAEALPRLLPVWRTLVKDPSVFDEVLREP